MAPTINQRCNYILQRQGGLETALPAAKIGSISARGARLDCKAASKRQSTSTKFQDKDSDFSTAEGSRGVTLHLSTHFQAAYGEQLRVVGSRPELGEWDVSQAPEMQWTDGHNWVTDVTLPPGSEVDFKVVHVAHHGITWEPGMNKAIKAEAAPSSAELYVTMAWGLPDLTKVVPREGIVDQSAEDLFSTTQEPEWDPVEAGLPEDVTAVLNNPMQTLNMDCEDESDVKVFSFASSGPTAEELIADSEALKGLVSTPEPVVQEAYKELVSEPKRVIQETYQELFGDDSADEAPKLLEKKRKAESAKRSGLKAAGQAAGFAVAGMVGAVVLSALAVDVTDAAIASAVVAAGATFLPGSKDNKGEKRALEGKGAATPFLGALELGLKASALASSFDKKKNNAAQATRESTPEPEDPKAAMIARKVVEAELFAESYNPTEEELFELTTPPLRHIDAAPTMANNALPTGGKLSKAPARKPWRELLQQKE